MKMTSEIGRMLKCLTTKSYHSLQDDAYSHISLIPQGDTSAESLDCPTPNLEGNEQDSQYSSSVGEKFVRVRRPRSAGDISESLLVSTGGVGFGQDIVIESGRPGSQLPHVRGIIAPNNNTSNNYGSTNNSQQSQNNHHNLSSNNTTSSGRDSGSGGGGILSFFGVRFNKSGTRHLDRSGHSSDSSDKPNKSVGDHRYTKFPLSPATSPTGAGQNILVNNNSGSVHQQQQLHHHPHSQHHHHQSSHSSSGVNSVTSPSIVQLQTDSPFDATHIHLTPQTKTYSHPHKSPVSPIWGTTSTSSSFLANAASLGRKAVNSVNVSAINKSSHHFRNKPLKVKSKSDNSLHRVTLNSTSSSSNSNRNSGVVTTTAAASNRGYPSPSSQQILSYPPPVGEQRLNSVQLGDHATIRLPWTGFQQNNLSSVTSSRAHPNTHNNNLDFESVRYVECGHVWNSAACAAARNSNTSSAQSRNFIGVTSRGNSNNSNSNSQSQTTTRRRSRSLERASNFRVFPVNCNSISSANCTSSNTNKSSTSFNSVAQQSRDRERERERARNSHSLERNHISQSHRVRHSLSAAEQEILLRNISRTPGNCGVSRSAAEVPHSKLPLPEKPVGLKNSVIIDSCGGGIGRHSNFSGNNKSHSRQSKTPLIGRLHRSAPNSSFSNSSESSDSASVSAPPSPPPRPPSTLKPESRLIVHPKKPFNGTPACDFKREASSPQFNFVSSNNSSPSGCSSASSNTVTSGNSMNPVPNRRPLPPRSQESSSDSGHSHNTGHTILSGGVTSDFSAEPTVTIHHSHSHPHSHSHSGSSIHHHSGGGIGGGGGGGGGGMSLEDARNSGFINKPTKGWLHSDQLLSKEGVTYVVRYIGCLDVNTSMKSLDFDTRSLIAKECINQVCEAAGLKSVDRKRKIDRRVVRILGFRPRLDHAGSDVHLTITSTCLKLTSLDTGAIIAVHDMPNISFASGGDATMLDFVAYVAKDSIVGRACFVLECGSGLAQDVITTVGQAFELRFKEYLQKRPQPPRLQNDDPEYYNDLPGKVPPDISAQDTKHESKSQSSSSKGAFGTGRSKEPPTLTLPASDKDLGVNLIDFEAPTPPAFGPSVQDKNLESLLLLSEPSGSSSTTNATASQGNGVGTVVGLSNSLGQQKDPFDMQPFLSSIPVPFPMSEADQKMSLEAENWYHGTISRGEAEALVRNDGDFLVRESQATPGQYVLTGLQKGSPKHLLLVDPEGVVRTKDRTFDSVIHLIRHHSDNSLPIISAESMVLLRRPVPRVISS